MAGENRRPPDRAELGRAAAVGSAVGEAAGRCCLQQLALVRPFAMFVRQRVAATFCQSWGPQQKWRLFNFYFMLEEKKNLDFISEIEGCQRFFPVAASIIFLLKDIFFFTTCR